MIPDPKAVAEALTLCETGDWRVQDIEVLAAAVRLLAQDIMRTGWQTEAEYREYDLAQRVAEAIVAMEGE